MNATHSKSSGEKVSPPTCCLLLWSVTHWLMIRNLHLSCCPLNFPWSEKCHLLKSDYLPNWLYNKPFFFIKNTFCLKFSVRKWNGRTLCCEFFALWMQNWRNCRNWRIVEIGINTLNSHTNMLWPDSREMQTFKAEWALIFEPNILGSILTPPLMGQMTLWEFSTWRAAEIMKY